MQKSKFEKIAIIGVGLIGGSIGLAVKKKKLADKVLGVGRRKSSLEKALKKGAVDEITLDKSKLRDCGLVILATPVGSIIPLVKEILPYLNKGVIVTDVGSTKREIMKEVERILPSSIHFIGAHPLAGREKSGVEFADADLFEDSICFLISGEESKINESLEKLKDFWIVLGASPIIISSGEHDFLMAGVSHLPHVVSVALANSVSGVNWRGKNITEFAGQGWKDTTRISKGSPEVWADILFSNGEKILLFLEKFSDELALIKNSLSQKNFEALKKILEKVYKTSV